MEGIFVNSLTSDTSPAALAGIQAGDVVTELNDQAVSNEDELSGVLDSLKAGNEVSVKVYRDGETITSHVKVGDRNYPQILPNVDLRDQGFLGIKDSVRRCCIPGTQTFGVEILELFENAPADLFELKLGDLIVEFDGHPVRTPNEFNRRIRSITPRKKVAVVFYRGKTKQKVELILGHRWDE